MWQRNFRGGWGYSDRGKSTAAPPVPVLAPPGSRIAVLSAYSPLLERREKKKGTKQHQSRRGTKQDAKSTGACPPRAQHTHNFPAIVCILDHSLLFFLWWLPGMNGRIATCGCAGEGVFARSATLRIFFFFFFRIWVFFPFLSFKLLKSSPTQRWKPPRAPRTDWFRFPVGCLKNLQRELKPSSAAGVIWDAPIGGTRPAPELPLHEFAQQLMCFVRNFATCLAALPKS